MAFVSHLFRICFAFVSHLIQSNAFESNASANANVDESNANVSANAVVTGESNATASANAAFALAVANASAFEHKPGSQISKCISLGLIRWQGHAVVSDHTVSNLSPTTPNHTCNYNINILVGLGQRFIQQRWSGNPKLARTIPFI